MINHLDLIHVSHTCVFLVSFNIHYRETTKSEMMNEKVTFFLIMCSCSLRKAVGVDEQERERGRERKGISN